MKKKIILLSFITIIISALSISFAYFTKDIEEESPHTLTSTLIGRNLDIKSDLDFYEYVNDYYLSKDLSLVKKEYNSDDLVSDFDRRYTIVLNVDIVLKNDLTITSDCHLNLNKKFIDLNGHNLYITNSYSGTMVVYNGTIKDSTKSKSPETPNVYINCPNSFVEIDSVLDSDNTLSKTIAVSNDEMLWSALEYSYANIQNHNINDFYSILLAENSTILNYYCPFHASTPSQDCICTMTDLHFIKEYKGYPVKFQYVVDGSNLNEFGNVILPDTGYIDVNLTITAICEEDSTKTQSKSVMVHIASPDQYAKMSIAFALEEFKQYIGKDANDNTTYVIPSTIMLPLEYNYVSNANGKIVYSIYKESSDALPIKDSKTDNDYFRINSEFDNYTTLHLNNTIKYIEVSYENTIDSITTTMATTGKIPILVYYEDINVSNESYAMGIIRELYNNEISIYQTNGVYNSPELYLVGHEKLDRYLERIKSISYDKKNDLDDTYIKVPNSNNQYLENIVVAGEPSITQTPYIEVTFTFNDDTIVKIDVPIVYDPGDTDPEGVDGFVPYYNFFNKEFIISTNNLTYHDFYIPLTLGAHLDNPIYKLHPYVITENNGNITYTEAPIGLFTFSIYYDYNDTDNKYNKIIEYDDFFNLSNTSLYDVISPAILSGDAKVFVDINQFMISSKNNIEYRLVYQPVYIDESSKTVTIVGSGTTDAEIQYFEEIKTRFFSNLEIPAIVRYTVTAANAAGKLNSNEYTQTGVTEIFESDVLYKKIYPYYSDEVATNDQIGVDYFILTANLGRYVESFNFGETKIPVIDSSGKVTVNELSTDDLATKNYSITSFRGIEYLDGVEELYLRNVYLDNATTPTTIIDEIEYISGMENLRILDISYNGLSDRMESYNADLPFPSGEDNNFIGQLSSLPNLEYLFLNDNYIYSFASLTDIPSLKYVNIERNKFKSDLFDGTGFFGALLEGIDDLLTGIINLIYGSDGVTNIGTFVSLSGNGCTVEGYNPDGEINDNRIIALSNIQYQDKLGTGVSIEHAYDYLSKDIDDYGDFADYSLSLGNDVTLTDRGTEFVFECADTTTHTNHTNCDTFRIRLEYFFRVSAQGNQADFSIPYIIEYKVERVDLN